MTQNSFNGNDDRPEVHIFRTKEGTVFEVVCGVLLLVMWVLTLWSWQHGRGTPGAQLTTDIIGTLTTVFCLACAYRPNMINIPTRITNERQTWTLVRLDRIICVEICLLFIGINLCDVLCLKAEEMVLFNIGFVIFLIVTIIIGTAQIRRIR